MVPGANFTSLILEIVVGEGGGERRVNGFDPGLQLK